MDAIEAQVVLPPQAKPLNAYARYYARGSDGDIIATYVLPGVLKAEMDGCGGIDCLRAPLIDAGQRRWLTDWSDLPVVSEPSCSLVFLTYSQAKHLIEELRCTEGLS